MHSKARRQAEVYTQDQDGNTKFALKSKKDERKSRNRKKKNPTKNVSAEMAAQRISAMI